VANLDTRATLMEYNRRIQYKRRRKATTRKQELQIGRSKLQEIIKEFQKICHELKKKDKSSMNKKELIT
jgi:hypothetical protein